MKIDLDTPRKNISPNRFDWPLLVMGLLILLVVNLNQLANWTQGFDYLIYDNHIQKFPQQADKKILIVEIDEQSLSLLGAWPWPRSYHAQMIDILTQAGAEVIAYNVIFASSDLADSNDQLLASAIEASGRTVLPLYFDRLLNQGDVTEVLPALEFREHSTLGHVNSYLDKDGTLRSIRLMDRFEDQRWPHFSFASYLFNHPNSPLLELNLDDVFIPYVTIGDFQRVSFVDVLTGLVAIEKIRQHTVFVGVTATSVGDPLLIPTRDGGRQTPAVVINANVYQAIENNQLISPLTHFLAFVINSLFVLLTLYLMPKLSGLQQFLMTVIFILVAWLLSYGLLFQGYWYRSAGLLLAILMLPFIWNLLRLSRLFHYLRMQVNHLKHQQDKKVFLLPNYHGLDTEADLVAFLDMMQITDYRIVPAKENTIQKPDFWEHQLEEKITQQVSLQLQGESKILCIKFNEYTSLENNKMNILKQLLMQKQREENSAYSRFQVDRDVFQKQLAIMDDFQRQVSISQALFEESIDGVAAGILVSDLTGKVLFQNKALRDLIRLDANTNNDMFRVIHLLSGDWLSTVQKVIFFQESAMVEAKIAPSIGENNEYRDVSVSLRCLQNKVDDNLVPLAPLLVFNITDITRIKQVQRSRSEMIDFLSHDLRSPMASLQAMVNQTRPTKGNILTLESVDLEDFIESVDMYSRRGLNFAEQFLELAKVEGEEDVELYELDIYSIAQNAFDALYHQAQVKEIKLELNIVDDYWVMTNGELLERVLLNLVSNAIKYGPSNSQVVLEVRELSGSLLQLSVKDNGPGIPADLSERLFKPYSRGKDNNTQKSQGIGLGLRFVDVALKRLGSKIEVESSVQGTRFYFNLESLDMGL